jgi:hypothetical protein
VGQCEITFSSRNVIFVDEVDSHKFGLLKKIRNVITNYFWLIAL